MKAGNSIAVARFTKNDTNGDKGENGVTLNCAARVLG